MTTWRTTVNDLPKFLIAYGGQDNRLAYTEDTVIRSLRSTSVRYGKQALRRTRVLSLPGYKDLTDQFIPEGDQ